MVVFTTLTLPCERVICLPPLYTDYCCWLQL